MNEETDTPGSPLSVCNRKEALWQPATTVLDHPELEIEVISPRDSKHGPNADSREGLGGYQLDLPPIADGNQ